MAGKGSSVMVQLPKRLDAVLEVTSIVANIAMGVESWNGY
jgi:hypothetical protein